MSFWRRSRLKRPVVHTAPPKSADGSNVTAGVSPGAPTTFRSRRRSTMTLSASRCAIALVETLGRDARSWGAGVGVPIGAGERCRHYRRPDERANLRAAMNKELWTAAGPSGPARFAHRTDRREGLRAEEIANAIKPPAVRPLRPYLQLFIEAQASISAPSAGK